MARLLACSLDGSTCMSEAIDDASAAATASQHQDHNQHHTASRVTAVLCYGCQETPARMSRPRAVRHADPASAQVSDRTCNNLLQSPQIGHHVATAAAATASAQYISCCLSRSFCSAIFRYWLPICDGLRGWRETCPVLLLGNTQAATLKQQRCGAERNMRMQ